MDNKFFMRSNKFLLIFVIIVTSLLSWVIALPSGANVTSLNNTTAPLSSPGVFQAFAGNLSEISLDGFSTTQAWQGFYGNVTGTIQLADSSRNVMYNWSVLNPVGEVYATNESAVIWTNIQCFNYTANGTFEDDSGQKGGISLYGLNLIQLENRYNISVADSDGVNETFNLNDHQGFYTNSLQFSTGECKNVKLFTQNGTGSFDEVLLYSPDSKAVVFTSILKRNALGFNGLTYDFEMVVLEDGHGSNTDTTPYYFYIEVQ